LKPLEVLSYCGEKEKLEKFSRGTISESLVDQLDKPAVNQKIVRLHQCLFGTALESITGLGVSDPEYEEARANCYSNSVQVNSNSSLT